MLVRGKLLVRMLDRGKLLLVEVVYVERDCCPEEVYDLVVVVSSVVELE